MHKYTARPIDPGMGLRQVLLDQPSSVDLASFFAAAGLPLQQLMRMTGMQRWWRDTLSLKVGRAWVRTASWLVLLGAMDFFVDLVPVFAALLSEIPSDKAHVYGSDVPYMLYPVYGVLIM